MEIPDTVRIIIQDRNVVIARVEGTPSVQRNAKGVTIDKNLIVTGNMPIECIDFEKEITLDNFFNSDNTIVSSTSDVRRFLKNKEQFWKYSLLSKDGNSYKKNLIDFLYNCRIETAKVSVKANKCVSPKEGVLKELFKTKYNVIDSQCNVVIGLLKVQAFLGLISNSIIEDEDSEDNFNCWKTSAVKEFEAVPA